MNNTPTPSAGGFEGVRLPVLGLAIERDTATGVCRLVGDAAAGAKTAGPASGDAGMPVLATGTLEACEAKRVTALLERYGTGPVNVATGTLGGKQLWADREVLAGWRVQENVITGHCRLLDPANVRKAWGAFESCRTALEAERVRRGLRPRSDRLVVVLHGLGRSRDSLAGMTRALEAAGFEVAAVEYPSTRRDLREHALQVRGILDAVEDIRTVSFVTHSLGGIVVRDLLSLDGAWKERIRVGRVVMIAPPSRGSVVAEVVNDWLPVRIVLGQVVGELTPPEVGRIPPPPCEFGIVAGGTGTGKGMNPLLDGDNDGLVTVESTRLDGAADFLLLDASHTFIMAKRECIEATLRFLGTGRFAAGTDAVR
jgi:hypothetical protein